MPGLPGPHRPDRTVQAVGYAGDAIGYARATRDLRIPRLWALLEKRVPAGSIVVDVGCGAGRDLEHFTAGGYRCIGVERDPVLAVAAASLGRLSVILGDARALPLPAGAADGVWVIGVLHEHPPADRRTILGEAARLLGQGGYVIVSLRAQRSGSIRPDGRSLYPARPRELCAAFGEAGFAVLQLDSVRIHEGPGRGRWLVVVGRKAAEPTGSSEAVAAHPVVPGKQISGPTRTRSEEMVDD